MLTRRDVLRMIPIPALVGLARAAEDPDFERIDTHVHIHSDAPALLAAIKASKWRGLDIVVCPASGDESFDLEEKLRATLKVQRDSGGKLAWASTFDARGFESPGFSDRAINRLRQSFEDGAVAVKIWKNIGMSIKSKSGDIPPSGRPRPAADLRGDPGSRQDADRPPRGAERRLAAAGCEESGTHVLLEQPAVAHVRQGRGARQGRDPDSPRSDARPLSEATRGRLPPG